MTEYAAAFLPMPREGFLNRCQAASGSWLVLASSCRRLYLLMELGTNALQRGLKSMQIGMSLTTSYEIERDPKILLDGLTEQVKAMAELGFASLSLGDHHVTQNHYFQVLPTMSHLSAFTGEMRLIPLFLLPFYNPILLAEQMATLDVISGGRTTVISGLGHQPEAHDAFETPQRLRVSRFVETFEIMRLLWEADDASYSGRHYNFSGVSINPNHAASRYYVESARNADPQCASGKDCGRSGLSPGWTPEHRRSHGSTAALWRNSDAAKRCVSLLCAVTCTLAIRQKTRCGKPRYCSSVATEASESVRCRSH